LPGVAQRLVESSDERAAAVLSAESGVCWAIANRDFGFAIDRRLPRLSQHSYAYDVLQGAPAQQTPSEVEGDTWLYFDLNPGQRLFESSMLLGSYDVALTVLWIKED